MAKLLLIDGENFKGKIRSVYKSMNKNKPKWHLYDFKGLLDKVLGENEFETPVFYIAKITEHKDSIEKSKQLIEEQRLLKTHLEKQGFTVITAGQVRGQTEEGVRGKQMLIFKEKGVDVRIAVDMVSAACDGKAKEIFLASSDSDLQPAIKAVRNRGLQCIYVGFETAPNKGMTFTTNRTILIRNSEILEFETKPQQLLL